MHPDYTRNETAMKIIICQKISPVERDKYIQINTFVQNFKHNLVTTNNKALTKIKK